MYHLVTKPSNPHIIYCDIRRDTTGTYSTIEECFSEVSTCPKLLYTRRHTKTFPGVPNMKPTPIAQRLDLAYPLYLYNIDVEDFPETPGELHMDMENTRGTCKDIDCDGCPIRHECENNFSILHLFPDLLKTNPEYFI